MEGISIMVRQIRMRNKLLDLIQAKQRKEKRLISQRELAARLGISVNTLKKWIRQDVQMYDEEVVGKICEYFDVSDIGDLFYLEELNGEPTA